MKLLFDQNLSPRLSARLGDIYPGSQHVKDFGLQEAEDPVVWTFAKDNGFTIVSKDSDFEQRGVLYGHPPKLVWVRLGNCSTAQIEDALRKYSAVIHTFYEDPLESVLVIP